MLQGEHSAILATFIKLPFVIKIFVLSISDLNQLFLQDNLKFIGKRTLIYLFIYINLLYYKTNKMSSESIIMKEILDLFKELVDILNVIISNLC